MVQNQLESLRRHTVPVADTGEFEAMRRYLPQDATTNPSLILKASARDEYRPLVERALASAPGSGAAKLDAFLDHLAVEFGLAILAIVPGRVSTEVDAKLSFDTAGTIAKARRLIALYEQRGVPRERVLIKIASTWEGIRAAAELERERIHCNMTLLFGFAQAVACAEAKVTLVSPFVGRIYDFWKKERGVADIPIDEDPGVASVTRIWCYYKKHGYATEVMGASFRKAEQIRRLCGCDLLTISPELLEELRSTPGEVPVRLTPALAQEKGEARIALDEKSYRFLHNDDPMAVAKLAEGIRLFDRDARKLEDFARTQIEGGRR
ncbi:MAG: transaldolase [Planctomycetota bacterium]